MAQSRVAARRRQLRGVVRLLVRVVRIGLSLGGHPAKSAVYAASVRAAVADLVHCAATGGVPVSNG